ncbi:DMT family transporter [bacterium]|nr:DMT family transporter [bacterium]
MPERRVTRAAAVDLAIAAALWGGMYVVSAETFAAIPPATLSLLRLAIGVGALAAFALLRGESLGWSKAPKGAALRAGAAVAISILLQFGGTALTSAVEGSVVTMATPVFVLIFGWALEGVRVPRQAWLGIVLAAVGVGALALRGGEGGTFEADASTSRLLGIAMLIGAGATWALFSSFGRPVIAAIGARNAVTLSAGLAIPMILPFAALELAVVGMDLAAATTPSALLAVAYLGFFATSIGWSTWYRGYAAAPPRLAAGALFLQPLVAAALGVGLLKEALDGGLALGALFLLGGIALISFERASSTKQSRVRS